MGAERGVSALSLPTSLRAPPWRGWLLVVSTANPGGAWLQGKKQNLPLLFFFLRRGIPKRDPTRLPASKQVLRTEMVRVPRRRKTKGTISGGIGGYKQATPTGF